MIYIASPETQAAVRERKVEEIKKLEAARRATLSAPTEALPLGHYAAKHIKAYVDEQGLTSGSSMLKMEIISLFHNCDWGNYQALRDHIRSKFISYSQREVIPSLTEFLKIRNLSLDELVAEIRNRVIGVKPLLRKKALRKETEQ